MKKLFFTLCILACSLCTWADDGVTAKVSGTTLDIALTNAVEYCAFQIDITLPSGISASEVKAVSARLTQEGSDTEVGGTKFIVASNVYDTTNNILRVIAYNLNNNAIAGNSGDNILNITLSAAPSTASDVKVSNITFVKKSDLASATFTDVTGEDGYEKGDVDHSGAVDGIDLSLVIDYILGKIDTTGLDTKLADMDNSDTVDGVDLGLIIDKILGK